MVEGVELTFTSGKVTQAQAGKNQPFLLEMLASDPGARYVGEFAIGTNTGLTRLIYNLLQDEKFPGIHLAFGSPLPAKTGAKWDSKAHVDGVLKNPTIYVDGKPIMTKGKFHLELLCL